MTAVLTVSDGKIASQAVDGAGQNSEIISRLTAGARIRIETSGAIDSAADAGHIVELRTIEVLEEVPLGAGLAVIGSSSAGSAVDVAG